MKASSPVTSVCMRCTGTNITSGKLVSRRQEYATVFKPDNMKFWSFSFSGGVAVPKTSYGCLDCGFIWTEADADALEDFVATKCKPVAKHS
jgi:hypothetical protein